MHTLYAPNSKSFNTQQPEGGWDNYPRLHCSVTGFNTQQPEGGWAVTVWNGAVSLVFQHTAARRRLGIRQHQCVLIADVSTHSSPKAAGQESHALSGVGLRFNTQQPEGGWRHSSPIPNCFSCFNTQQPEGGWGLSQKPCSIRFHSTNFAKLPRKAEMRV